MAFCPTSQSLTILRSPQPKKERKMVAMAVASSSLTSPIFSPHLHAPSRDKKLRQVWHLNTGQATGGISKKGGLICAKADNVDPSTSQDETSVSRRWPTISRRQLASLPAGSFWGYLISTTIESDKAIASQFADMPALRGKDYGKTKMNYPDYVQTESGLQYKSREVVATSVVSLLSCTKRAMSDTQNVTSFLQDLRPGSGPAPNVGNTVVVDWDGYTIGYYGRIFEARNKAKGGSFEGDEKNFFRFKLGNAEVIPAFEEAVATMKVGGVRRIIVPPELGYPNNDYNRKGPQPTTFSGQRALDFVLRNQGLIDKTLLFDIELLKVAEN